MTGYHVGAVLTALLALAFIEKLGWDWRTLFVFGGVAGLLSVPLMWARMPESQAYEEARAQGAEGTRSAAASITGALVTAGIAYPWGFYVFAIAAVIAALALTIVPAMAPKGQEQKLGGPGFARV